LSYSKLGSHACYEHARAPVTAMVVIGSHD